MRKFLFIFLVMSFIIYPFASSASDEYVFFRGYHYQREIQQPLDILKQRGVYSRSLQQGDIPSLEMGLKKINLLHRSWNNDEIASFNPVCATPYQDLVQLYTNSYTTFVQELTQTDSRTRRIFRLAGLEPQSNPFISTSLNTRHAYKYGCGLKFFKHESRRLYPGYDNLGIPLNDSIGFVDVFVIPKKDLSEARPFFVVESFALNDTKLSYHFSKKLTEEEEVIFPFGILEKYHRARFSVSCSPLCKGVWEGKLHYNRWKKNLSSVSTPESQKAIEHKLVKRISEIHSDGLEQIVQRDIPNRVKKSSAMNGFARTLTPNDAIVVHKAIEECITYYRLNFFDPQKKKFKIAIDAERFEQSHALRHIADGGYPVKITYTGSINTIYPELMNIFLGKESVKKLTFKGDPKKPSKASSLRKVFSKLPVDDPQCEQILSTLWFVPLVDKTKGLIKCVQNRKTNLDIDVSGLGIQPHLLTQLQDWPIRIKDKDSASEDYQNFLNHKQKYEKFGYEIGFLFD
jgi:hypothetical protein